MQAKVDTRQAIVNAAQELFAHKGFQSTTVREIAARAGVNIAMVYYYFQTKEKLYRTIIEDSFQSLAQLLIACVEADRKVEENLYCLIKVFIGFFAENRILHRIMLREIAARSEHIEVIVKKYISRNFALINGVLQEGVRGGVFRPVDTVLTTFSLIGMILHYFNAEPVIRRLVGEQQAELITRYLPEHVFDLLMKGIGG